MIGPYDFFADIFLSSPSVNTSFPVKRLSSFSVCYPNETIVLTNPDSSTYTHVVAVEDEGTSSATDCSVSLSGTLVEITSCDLVSDLYIVILICIHIVNTISIIS